jgi:hypothetical protein
MTAVSLLLHYHIFYILIELHGEFECATHDNTQFLSLHCCHSKAIHILIQFLLLEGSTNPKAILIMSIFNPRCEHKICYFQNKVLNYGTSTN